MTTAANPEIPVFTFGRWLNAHFGFRLRKLSIDGGFSCPNLDGTKATGGCAYCNNLAFAPGARDIGGSIEQQVQKQRQEFLQRHARRARDSTPAPKFMVYFQAYTNTHAPIDVLKVRYDAALNVSDDIVGLAVGTRPDSVPDPVLDLLESYANDGYHVWLELGLQSIHDHLHADLNRHCTVGEYDDAVRRANGRGLHLCAHLIFGLPGETPDHMRATVEHIAGLPLHGVKFHQLHVVRDTELARRYAQSPFPLLQPEEYIQLVADALTRLPPDIAIQRVAGESTGELLIAPRWNLPPSAILSRIEQTLRAAGQYQGSRYSPS